MVSQQELRTSWRSYKALLIVPSVTGCMVGGTGLPETVFVEGRITDPLPQFPRTCEYVTLHGKRDFADVIKGTALEMKRVFWMTHVGPIKSFKS